MESLIDDLVNVTVSISKMQSDNIAFNNILLVDVSGAGTCEDVAEATTLSAVSALGFSSDSKTYKAASVAFANEASTIYIISKLKDESISDTLDRASKSSNWYGIFEVDEAEDENGDEPDDEEPEDESELNKYARDFAAWAEDNNKLFCYTVDCSEGIENPITDGYNYAAGFATRGIEENESNEFLAVGVMAKCMQYAPESATWAYKSLTSDDANSITADEWTMSEINALRAQNLNFYSPCGGKDIVLDGKVLSGEYIDTICFRDWLVANIQSKVYGLLTRNPKVPYTDAGIALIETQIISALQEGQSAGGIAETTYDDDGNETPGFTVTVPRLSSIGDSDRYARILKGCKFTARLTGAIHAVEIRGTLEV